MPLDNAPATILYLHDYLYAIGGSEKNLIHLLNGLDPKRFKPMAQPMRILQLISSLGFFGAENVLVELARAQKRLNYDPIVGVFYSRHDPHIEVGEEARRSGLDIALFPCDKRFDPRTFAAIRCFIKQKHIDIVHSHNYKSNFYALFSTLGFDIPLVTTCHNWTGRSYKMRFYTWLDKLFLGRFDKVVAVSGPVERELLRSGIARVKVENIPNGIDLKRFDGPSDNGAVRQELGIPDGFKVVGTVGRLTDEKGHIHLIRAAKKVVKELGSVVFLIVGDGPNMAFLKEKAASLPFIFAGIRDDIPRLYLAMDVFVLPSLNEGLPMVLLEAMASKKPVIATRVGDIPEVLAEGVNGILIRAGREDELVGAMLELLKDEKKQKQLGVSGYRKVIRDYSSAKMAEHYVKVYKAILEKRQ